MTPTTIVSLLTGTREEKKEISSVKRDPQSWQRSRASSPASASDEKCADHCTKVPPSLRPEVMGEQRSVEMTLLYERAGVELMTL